MLPCKSRMWVVGLVAAIFFGLATVSYQPLRGQEQAETLDQAQEADGQPAARAERRRPRGRLPAYYTRVVSGDQREQIYKIQQSYEPKIQELLAQVRELRQERDQEIDAKLTPEQRERVNQLRSEARDRQAEQRRLRNRGQSDKTDAPQ